MNNQSSLQLVLSAINITTTATEIKALLTNYCLEFCNYLNHTELSHGLTCRIVENPYQSYCLVNFESQEIAKKFAKINNLITIGFNTVIIKLPFPVQGSGED